MSINIEIAIKYMYDLRLKNIRYSMVGSRTGADRTGDCSGTIYQGLRNAGATNAGWVLNTDSMHGWLAQNDFERIAENQEWDAKRGDIVIFGKKGASGGTAGHVVLFINKRQIIHCTYKTATANGIYVDDEATTCPYSMGWYVYRLKEAMQTYPLKAIDTVVTVQSYAQRYQTGELIAEFVKGSKYKVKAIKNIRQSKSKRAYLLSQINSWVLEQDVK